MRAFLFASAWALAFVAAAPAAAVVYDVHLVEGPSDSLRELSDAAMAEDGSGGIVYLKRVEGRDRVFAAQFVDGAWRPPQRVDVGQGFDSSWPRIGAGDGGRLVVTWVGEWGAQSDRMFSATLDPGARGFQPPVPIDLNVGEATSTHPDLAMNRGGQAYLAYRVVTDTSPANPPGYLGADLRLARYNGRLWSLFGAPLDRNAAVPVRLPNAENAPRVGIDVQGQGAVAWQEPDDEFVDRVWARRLFGSSFGIPLLASPTSWDGAPLRGPVDAFALDVSGFGQAAVALRQHPGQAGKLGATRLLVNTVPDVFSEAASRFLGAHLADGEARAGLGAPGVAVDPRGRYLTSFGAGEASLLAAGDEAGGGAVERLDGGSGGVGGGPLVDLAPTGAALAAWREQRGGAGVVAVQERRADGVVEPAALSAPAGGAVAELALAGSGLGDGIVAWRQGAGAGAQIAAAVVDAPPDPFLVLLPNGWQRRKRVRIAWDHSPNAVGPVAYSVSVDDEPVREGLRGLSAVLRPDDLGNGRRRIQVFAVDGVGQETGSRVGRLPVDRRGPRVRLLRRGRKLSVVVADGRPGAASGLRVGSVKVAFGGPGRTRTQRGSGKARARRGGKAGASFLRATRTYSRPGRYRVRVRARDRAGNVTAIARRVRIR